MYLGTTTDLGNFIHVVVRVGGAALLLEHTHNFLLVSFAVKHTDNYGIVTDRYR